MADRASERRCSVCGVLVARILPGERPGESRIEPIEGVWGRHPSRYRCIDHESDPLHPSATERTP